MTSCKFAQTTQFLDHIYNDFLQIETKSGILRRTIGLFYSSGLHFYICTIDHDVTIRQTNVYVSYAMNQPRQSTTYKNISTKFRWKLTIFMAIWSTYTSHIPRLHNPSKEVVQCFLCFSTGWAVYLCFVYYVRLPVLLQQETLCCHHGNGTILILTHPQQQF